MQYAKSEMGLTPATQRLMKRPAPEAETESFSRFQPIRAISPQEKYFMSQQQAAWRLRFFRSE
jgi:hypothetical protein